MIANPNTFANDYVARLVYSWQMRCGLSGAAATFFDLK